MAKTLVAYFSASGVTQSAAQALAQAAGADLFEIKPAQPYTDADLNWMNKKSRSSLEQNDPASRPAVAETCGNMADYDLILLGFPIWWYTAPVIVKTYLEQYDLTGKRIVLFATSGGSGLGRSADDLKASCPGASIRNGKLLNGRLSQKELANWVKSL